jgi:hypothetical protein
VADAGLMGARNYLIEGLWGTGKTSVVERERIAQWHETNGDVPANGIRSMRHLSTGSSTKSCVTPATANNDTS